MSIFDRFFADRTESIVLIDVSSASVAGAYAHFKRGEIPTILYTNRIPINSHGEEPNADDMERTLKALSDTLISEGSPALARYTGSGAISQILITVGAPWQDTQVRVVTVEKKQPFTFSHAILKDALMEITETPEGRIISEESVIATLLNGYETGEPFGKQANRADLVVLLSTLDGQAAEIVTRILRSAYHTHEIRVSAFAPVAYAVFRDVYPHEKEYLILDVTGETTDLILVKKGLLAGIASTTKGLADMLRAADRVPMQTTAASESLVDSTEAPRSPSEHSKSRERIEAAKADWLGGLTESLSTLAKEQALPRTVFLLASEDSSEFLKSTLHTGSFSSLWLSDDPLSVIPVLPEHLAPYVHTRGDAEGDTVLAMLALFQNKRTQRE